MDLVPHGPPPSKRLRLVSLLSGQPWGRAIPQRNQTSSLLRVASSKSLRPYPRGTFTFLCSSCINYCWCFSSNFLASPSHTTSQKLDASTTHRLHPFSLVPLRCHLQLVVGTRSPRAFFADSRFPRLHSTYLLLGRCYRLYSPSIFCLLNASHPILSCSVRI